MSVSLHANPVGIFGRTTLLGRSALNNALVLGTVATPQYSSTP